MSSSTLYIIPTPIGNLADITYSGVRCLQEVDFIACEDTRTSKVLLKHYEIDKPLVAFHQHNEHRQTSRICERIKAGQSGALITDAGTPGISDPGFLLIRQAYQDNLKVTVLPGPDAATTALLASGLPCDRYIFEGFLPHKKGRKARIERFIDEDRTIVLYESPHRIMKLLNELLEHCDSERMGAVVREMTKSYEEVIRGSLKQIRDKISDRSSIKGEICMVLAGKNYKE